MYISNHKEYYQDSIAAQPEIRYGADAVVGTSDPWLGMALGSQYIRQSAGNTERWFKAKNDGTVNDWVLFDGVLIESFTYDEMTDGGSTAGTYVLTGTIPVGAIVTKTMVVDVTGFTGDTSAAMTVGDGSTADRYMTSTLNVVANAAAIDGGAVSGTALHTTAVSTVTVTITGAADFTSISAGAATVAVFYQAIG